MDETIQIASSYGVSRGTAIRGCVGNRGEQPKRGGGSATQASRQTGDKNQGSEVNHRGSEGVLGDLHQMVAPGGLGCEPSLRALRRGVLAKDLRILETTQGGSKGGGGVKG